MWLKNALPIHIKDGRIQLLYCVQNKHIAILQVYSYYCCINCSLRAFAANKKVKKSKFKMAMMWNWKHGEYRVTILTQWWAAEPQFTSGWHRNKIGQQQDSYSRAQPRVIMQIAGGSFKRVIIWQTSQRAQLMTQKYSRTCDLNKGTTV